MDAPAEPDDTAVPAAPDDTAVPAAPGRRELHTAPAAPWWGPWPAFFVLTGVGAGILWWLLAPGGAFHGDGKDFTVWFPRDATLAALMVLAGILSAVFALRGTFRPGRRSTRSSGNRSPAPRPKRRGAVQETPGTALFLAMVAGSLGASVLAWRTGVFAGDLFRSPPVNMPNPSIVFSLRSAAVLVLWPLTASLAVFLAKLVAYSVTAGPSAETMQGRGPHSG